MQNKGEYIERMERGNKNIIERRNEFLVEKVKILTDKVNEITRIANKLATKNIELNLLLQAKVDKMKGKKNEKNRVQRTSKKQKRNRINKNIK